MKKAIDNGYTEHRKGGDNCDTDIDNDHSPLANEDFQLTLNRNSNSRTTK